MAFYLLDSYMSMTHQLNIMSKKTREALALVTNVQCVNKDGGSSYNEGCEDGWNEEIKFGTGNQMDRHTEGVDWAINGKAQARGRGVSRTTNKERVKSQL